MADRLVDGDDLAELRRRLREVAPRWAPDGDAVADAAILAARQAYLQGIGRNRQWVVRVPSSTARKGRIAILASHLAIDGPNSVSLVIFGQQVVARFGDGSAIRLWDADGRRRLGGATGTSS